jgi:nucleoside 2-deoxyribosyltransferase
LSASLTVADCTGRNPNVFYEIGLAHALGKPVILITQNSEDIPFDVTHIRYIQYEFTPRGMERFEQKLIDAVRASMEIKSA